MKRLDHRNILKLHDLLETDHSIYMVVDLLEGGNLIDKMRNKNDITMREIIEFMKGILKALRHMHEKKIMHRDLKPENILFRKEDSMKEVILVDFGLATFVDEEEYLFSRCGTPGFVAPEVVNLKDPKGKYSCKCDLFSIGVILHIL